MLCVSACSSDDSGNPDASDAAADVKLDKKVVPETSTDDGNSGQCQPETTIDSSQIVWTPPITPDPNACSAAQVQALWDGCFDTSTASNTKCTGFLNATANATCSKCMISTYQKDKAYGALIQIGGVDYANVSGCIAILSGDSSATGCGAKNEAVTECETLACSTSCPQVIDQTTFKEYTTCTNTADDGICKSYVDAQCNLADAGAAAACTNHSGFQDYYFSYAPIFCGAYATDGGTDGGTSDGGTDGSTDSASDAPTDAPDDGG